MKNLITCLASLLIFFTSTNQARATHLAGAEITYKYVGNGSNYLYEVTLIVYRATKDKAGLATSDLPGADMDICISSGCYGSNNYNLSRVLPPPGQQSTGFNANPQAWATPGLDECAPTNDPQFIPIEMHIFRGNVTLPGNCADYVFSWSGFARNEAIDNLVNPGGRDLYIEATLNTTLGHNTSPQFVTPAAKAFCVNQPFIWSQATTEPDGDSIRYSFAQPLDGGGCPSTTTPIPYSSGYSLANPMTTASGITVNAKTGTFTFTPTNPEVVVLKVDVDEYRFNTTLGQWLKIGSVSRDLQVIIATQCKSSTANGPRIDTSAPGFSQTSVGIDSLKGFGFAQIGNDSVYDSIAGRYEYIIPVIGYNCYDSLVNLQFNIDVLCSSIASNGTDFRLVGPDTIARPVVATIKNCKPDLTTDSIQLVLHKPLDVNGDYFLQVKVGGDGNTLTNRCGFELPEFYTMIIRVENCPLLSYELENVTVVEDNAIRLDWTVVDSTFSSELFTSWNILRSNNGSPFYSIDQLQDISTREYMDQSLDIPAIDAMPYKYAIQLVENFTYRSPTNNITSVWLKSEELSGGEGLILSWTPYNGWDDPHYKLSYSKSAPAGSSPNWVDLAGADPQLLSFEYRYPEIPCDSAGLYMARVLATDPNNPANSYRSESNWVYFELECDSIDSVVVGPIPNIFTPNNDNSNDFFRFQVKGYSRVSLIVYNRWGKVVYENVNFEDNNSGGKGWDGTEMNSGRIVADGVYYYIINMVENNTDALKELKGSVTVLGNGTN